MPSSTRALYRQAPFSSEMQKGDSYVYSSISDCLEMGEETLEGFIKCRALGILQSEYGRYYLKDLQNIIRIQVSMVYMKESPKSTAIPYPVQMFGELKWRKRPVIFARVIQILTPAIALRMKDTMDSITRIHRIFPDGPNPLNTTFNQTQDGFNETFDASFVSKVELGLDKVNNNKNDVSMTDLVNHASSSET